VFGAQIKTETQRMPKQDEAATLDEEMQAFLAQLDVVRESWQGFVDAEGALKEATKWWQRGLIGEKVTNGRSLDNKVINFAVSADFVPIDTALADASRTFEAFCASVQVMQSAFDRAMKAAESGSGEDLGAHGDALGAAIEGMPEIVAQSTAAQAAWTQGMAAFMPRYRKAKLEAIERGTEFRKRN
jgi:hypothetical protein